MSKQNLDYVEKKLDQKINRRQRKNKTTIRVSGDSVKQLQKLIMSKGKKS